MIYWPLSNSINFLWVRKCGDEICWVRTSLVTKMFGYEISCNRIYKQGLAGLWSLIQPNTSACTCSLKCTCHVYLQVAFGICNLCGGVHQSFLHQVTSHYHILSTLHDNNYLSATNKAMNSHTYVEMFLGFYTLVTWSKLSLHSHLSEGLSSFVNKISINLLSPSR